MSEYAPDLSRRSFVTRSLTGAGLLGLASFANAEPATIVTSDVVNVRDSGAIGDGKADDTTAIQAALDRAAKTTP
ncbi:MAG: Pectate lyase superfamily protein, partial [Verrucomicrobiales bacterium]|nr:Pectate lyase superfamily protein [Verrucomicrobiales bacterium]